MTKAGAGHPFGAVRSRTDGPDTENGLYGDLGQLLVFANARTSYCPRIQEDRECQA